MDDTDLFDERAERERLEDEIAYLRAALDEANRVVQIFRLMDVGDGVRSGR